LWDTVSSTDGFIAKAKCYGYHGADTGTAAAVHPEVKYSKHLEQTVEIHYTDIGYIGGEVQQDKESPQQEIIA